MSHGCKYKYIIFSRYEDVDLNCYPHEYETDTNISFKREYDDTLL